jgi:small conductance mechanosensitive channel
MNDWMSALADLDWARWGGPLGSTARIVAIVIAAWILIIIAQRVVRTIRLHVAERLGTHDGARRAETLGRVFRYLIGLVIGAVATMLVLAELGISLAPILGAAGVVGLAVGFGAQSLVKDYFTGFFILFEDQIRKGDIVRVADLTGGVEDITLRHVRLRDYDGNTHYIPNSLISTVTNMGRSFAQAVVEVGVAYREDTDDVMAVMCEVAEQLRGDEAFGPRILEPFDMAGVDRWDDSAVVIKGRFKVQPLEQWAVRREYLRRLKVAFDAKGIEIPFPHLTLYAGLDKAGQVPALPLRLVDGARPAAAVATAAAA